MMRDRDAAHVALMNEVRDLWTRWVSKSDLVKPDAEQALEGLEDPVSLLRHMREMMVMHSPTLAGVRLRKVQEVVNSAWRRFFRHRLDIRGDTLAVVAALEALTAEKATRVEELERQRDVASRGERERRGQVRGAVVAARRAEAEVERLRTLSTSAHLDRGRRDRAHRHRSAQGTSVGKGGDPATAQKTHGASRKEEISGSEGVEETTGEGDGGEEGKDDGGPAVGAPRDASPERGRKESSRVAASSPARYPLSIDRVMNRPATAHR